MATIAPARVKISREDARVMYRRAMAPGKLSHRGRHQAQGNDIPSGTDSRKWERGEPYTADEGHSDLDDLEAGLSSRARNLREKCFKLAHRFVKNAQAGGGVGPTSESFPAGRPNEDTDKRVDIEVKTGMAFV